MSDSLAPSLPQEQPMSLSVPSHIQRHHVRFDKYESAVKPFAIPRPLDSYRHFIMVFVIKKDDPRYKQLKTFLHNWIEQCKLTLGYIHHTLNFAGEMTEKSMSIQQLSAQKVYFTDLRKEKDTDLGLQINLHSEPWVNNQFAMNMLCLFRGCIVFADTMSDIPHCWMTKSLCGLTVEEIDPFLKRGLGIATPISYESDDNLLHGYVKMIRAHTFVAF